MMQGGELRAAFLRYFADRDHRIVKSSPLIPADDPTLLFTNAGMVQFKRVFLQEETRDYKRAASVQKCLRAGGKHNDMEQVGRTARHHTFFEMLGNFSFGDYFKEGAIEMAWEFLTQVLCLPTDRLWVSVFKEDEEAARIWENKIGVPEQRIVRLGEQDNFWAMGDTGPCGPCSEIIIDQGEGVGCGRASCSVGCSCDRYLELWNLVFMQYNRGVDGALTPLPKPCIDTGMGLERVTAVVQGATSNYDTDLFAGIIARIEELSGAEYKSDQAKDISIRVIADHARAITFLLADGVLPANEGRGYVLRRIIRRALRHGRILGIDRPFLVAMAERVAEVMGDAYPEILDGRDHLHQVLQREEGRFSETLDHGLRILKEEIDSLRGEQKEVLPGEVAFKLYDTYGFPIDLTEEIAREEGMGVDMEGFKAAMQRQKRQAREQWKGTREGLSPLYQQLISDGVTTAFVGYEALQGSSHVLRIIKKGEFVAEAGSGDEVEVITELTPFYGESGGQIGDRGVIRGDELLVEVIDTIRPVPELIVHKGVVKKGVISVGGRVFLEVDRGRRIATARNHTATHLLQAALRRVVGGHIKQAGSLVAPERLRFDFTHYEALDEEILARVEDMVNRWIWEDHPVCVEVMATEEAIARGATALFGERYGDQARVISLGDFSQELCGGSHVTRTGQIGLFTISSEGGVAAGIRRIEAMTGQAAYEYLRSLAKELKEAARRLRSRPGEVVTKIEGLMGEARQMARQLEAVRQRLAAAQTGVGPQVQEVKGVKVAAFRADGVDPKGMRGMGDGIKERIGSGVVLVGGVNEGKTTLVLMVTKNLAGRIPADELIKGLAEVIGGRGGGNPTLAQAGGERIDGLDAALQRIYGLVEERL